ncbi:hypothetical protein ABZ619_26875 [Streptomyces sp. NPDC007851]|uniref:hypothetical protein n=1 Tax=Streptomyces sp. NPDC007851 TaxID=3155008 RepID=UPI0033D202B2
MPYGVGDQLRGEEFGGVGPADPIPGTRSPRRLAENTAAAHDTLTPGDLARVQEILPDGAAGSRYPEPVMPTWP